MCNLLTSLSRLFPTHMTVATLAAILLAVAPLSQAEIVTIDQMVGLQSPIRLAVSSTGDVIVADHGRGEVVVFDETGMKIATLRDLNAPLGLAIREVDPPPAPAGETPPPVPSPVPAYCPAEQSTYVYLLNKYNLKAAAYESLVEKYAELIGQYKDLLAQAVEANKKKRIILRLTRTLKILEARAAKYENKMTEFQDLVTEFAVCDVWSTPETPPVATTSVDDPVWLPVIYVGDEANGSVQVLNNGSVSSLGAGNGEFGKPNGIAVTADGTRVYVVDSTAHQVKVYDDTGTLQSSFGSQGAANGQLDFPIDIALNEAAGELYVSDFQNARIVVFDLGGTWLRNMAAPLNDAGDPAFNKPSGLGIAPNGNLYVADNALSCVVIMNSTGSLIDMIGYKNGQYWTGELSLPLDVAADGQRIYVTSASGQNGVVKIFEEVSP